MTLTDVERARITDHLRRAKAYAEQAEEMLRVGEAKQFRADIKVAKSSLDAALAAFTSAEDRGQTSSESRKS